jgi:GT2 family glycosyltransferase
VLNPDVLLTEPALLRAMQFMIENIGVGLLTPKILSFDGEQQYLCKKNPNMLDMLIRAAPFLFSKRFYNERMSEFEMRNHDYQSIISSVPYPSGCFMFFRYSILAAIGGFDERFFLHYEDADIGRSVSCISNTTYVPEVVIHHKWSRETHKSFRMKIVTIISGFKYLWKWSLWNPTSPS